MPFYMVEGVWEHIEWRMIEARNPQEAKRKAENNEYYAISDWTLGDLLNIEDVVKMTPQEILAIKRDIAYVKDQEERRFAEWQRKNR